MSIIKEIRSIFTAIRDRNNPLEVGSIVLGRQPGSALVSGRRVALSPQQITDGITVTGTTGSGIIEAARLITSRLLDAGRRVVLLSDNESISLFKYFIDLSHTHTAELIAIDDGHLIRPDMAAPPPALKNALERSWHDSDLIGIAFPGHRNPTSSTYLRDMMAWVKARWPDRVVIFVGYACGQTGPIENLSSTIMMFNAPVEPERLTGLSRSMGGFIRMRQDVPISRYDEWSLNAGEGLISHSAGSTEKFQFDYLPMFYDHSAMSLPFPFVLVPGSDGDARNDLKKLSERAA